jgi:hypothetical protein
MWGLNDGRQDERQSESTEGGLKMPNFVTFDDGLNYVSISEIEGFGYDGEGPNKGGIWIKLRDGRTVQTSWEVSKVAEFLGPTANLQY